MIFLFTHGLSSDASAKIYDIYNEYKYLMMKVALSYDRDHHSAEDIVSLSFFKIKKYISRIGDIPSMSAQGYIVRIVKSVAIDYQRKKKITTNISLDQLLEEQGFESGSNTPGVEELIIMDEMVDGLKTALESLDKKYYLAVIYHKYFGLTLKETAEKMGIASENTVASLSSRGLSKLKDAVIKGGVTFE